MANLADLYEVHDQNRAIVFSLARQTHLQAQLNVPAATRLEARFVEERLRRNPGMTRPPKETFRVVYGNVRSKDEWLFGQSEIDSVKTYLPVEGECRAHVWLENQSRTIVYDILNVDLVDLAKRGQGVDLMAKMAPRTPHQLVRLSHGLLQEWGLEYVEAPLDIQPEIYRSIQMNPAGAYGFMLEFSSELSQGHRVDADTLKKLIVTFVNTIETKRVK
jgi:hypothetical protein